MVLFYNIIEIFGLAHDNRSLVGLVVVFNGCGIRTALIDGDFFWEPLDANGLAQEGLGSAPVARGRQQKIKGSSLACVRPPGVSWQSPRLKGRDENHPP